VPQESLANTVYIKKIIYFTDGAAQNYKNRYQMVNLLLHKSHIGIEAEANFHATSHGKTACNGLGATFKREARQRSIQLIDFQEKADLAKKATKSVKF